MSKIKEFTVASARPLPVILLADISGSMKADGKIDTLNGAIAEMIHTFAEEDATQAEVHVAVITFGSTAQVHQPLVPARAVQWKPLHAQGRTFMGAAFDLARAMIEDREQIPSRAYRPTIVLVSDGIPTDEWHEPLRHLLGSERAGKAQRFALGIGADAHRKVLSAFLADPEARVFESHESCKIKNFFRWVTMSVSQRMHSATPNQSIMVSPNEIDDFDDF